MSFHWCDNIHTTIFTPRDYQIELLSAAFERNVMICLGHKSSKEFIALKLLQELARQARIAGKINLYLTCEQNTPSITTMIEHLTDLKVFKEESGAGDKQLVHIPHGFQLYVLHPRSCLEAMKCGILSLKNVHLMILEDCHEAAMYRDLRQIFCEFFNGSSDDMPKVLGLAGPLHSAECSLEELSAMLNTLENSVHCKAETASDIVTVLRYCAKPSEYIVQCMPYERDELTVILEEIICTRKAFLIDHRYDPFEIYSTDEYMEELKDIPDPKEEPMEFLETMLFVLYEMGPWCADRVAINMFHRIEKQKIKTPHERHYILLCVVNTALLEFHAICEHTFKKLTTHKELVERFSSPKVSRLLETLRVFKPEELMTKNETIQKMSQDLDQMDFQKLSRSIEYSCHSVENVTTKLQIESRSIIDNLDPIVKSPPTDQTRQQTLQSNTAHKSENNTGTNRRHGAGSSHGRFKRRPFNRRLMRDNSDTMDTLCAIIFCNSNYTARVLFDLLSEMSRHDPELKFLKCQFTTDRVADPITEPKEAEIEHRRQEEVLKRFRMHDCNVLIGTSVLEEGIDLPKCNLVVRWDAPTTYRSYVQCKGRARAAPAYYVILVSPAYKAVHCKNEQLSDQCHGYLCKIEDGQDDGIDSDSGNEDEETSNDNGNKFTIGSSKGIVKILNPEVITSKPPTKSEITLKEIKDELPAIEGTESETTDAFNLVEIEDELPSITELKYETPSIQEIKLVPIKPIDICYEVLDLNDAISDISSVLNNSASSSFLEETSTATKAPPKAQKVKRRFQCVCENAKDSESMDTGVDAVVQQIEYTTNKIVEQLAEYREIEKMLLQKCANTEPSEMEHQFADYYNKCVRRYKPCEYLLTGASVDLTSSIALVNKYCSKLPSDTFTKLTALWRCTKTMRCDAEVYQYTIRLPINSPLKYDIVGLPMSSNILARRMAALQACIELHKTGELDDNLQPIGKEGFRAVEPDWENFELAEEDEKIVHENSEPRPGTTKRRQYYYKRIASEFSECRPTAGVPCYLYFIDLTLQCPIPEEQNTRGRKIYPPEDAQQGFGILTLKRIPKVSSFPIFTRSGEVKVSIVLSKDRVILTETQICCINTFLNYTFTNVLRLQKFLMLFDPDSTENCVFIVPTLKKDGGKLIDWDFLELIERNSSMMPTPVPDELRKCTDFDANKFKDAVVMPWYRNQDQPQYFYVAEICPQLSPLSCFPGENYRTFKHYYSLKYGLTIQNVKQPLLDVDHTSARLNFLTPRYVNRKGVALPTSSEETKRAKRENLEQKQILVPELCTVHPFPASLWRTAVCLPCILYRINGLLLADDIRKKVSMDIGLGQQDIADNFEWPMLDFGWSLSEVLKRSKESKNASVGQENKDNNGKEESNGKQNNSFGTDNGINGECGNSVEENQSKAKSANEIIIEGEKKLQDSTFIEIGTWSNDMADDLNFSKNSDSLEDDEEECLKYFPSNVSFCDQQLRYGSPTFWDLEESEQNKKTNEGMQNKGNVPNHYRKNSFAYYDSDDSLASSYDGNEPAKYSDDEDDDDCGPLRIAFTSKNEAETIETVQEIEKHNKQLSIIQATNANERNYQKTKNLLVGYNFVDLKPSIEAELRESIAQFTASTKILRMTIEHSGMLVKYNQPVALARKEKSGGNSYVPDELPTAEMFFKLLPYADKSLLMSILDERGNLLTPADIALLNADYLKSHPLEMFEVQGCGDIFDNFNDKDMLKLERWGEGYKKLIQLRFDRKVSAESNDSLMPAREEIKKVYSDLFSFDRQPDLTGHPGPSPSIILQALTMSNANDGINLERLETIGDSFLKYAITTYLYITYENVHEGKLSHLRSKQVANLNLYRLGRRKKLGEYMIATKFEPHDNWLPPCYFVPKELEKALIEAKIPPHHWKLVDLSSIKKLNSAEICALVREKADKLGLFSDESNYSEDASAVDESGEGKDFTCFIPYNLVTQHSIPDKSVADCVEALIGAYLIECGPRGALLFMAWLGIRVLPFVRKPYNPQTPRIPGSTCPDDNGEITVYGEWAAPKSPLLHYSPNATQELEYMLEGFDEFEATLGYKFRDRSYLLQAMTHASYSPNRLTDCYQRLEFLGDAVLDYLITRHLYEDPRQHSPGALTDLRSALVNNTIFASLAVRHGFHKYFRHLSPGLNEVIDRFVRIQNENGHSISEEYYLLSEEECDDAEDVEVPKALGDVFESIAGAIFLDSNMSLDVVWQVYSNMMKPEIEQFSNSVPKSPIRELLELEPETAKFGKPEKLADGRRVRVTVEVFLKGTFRGIGRNYRIAKCTAAKCALRQLKKQGLITKKD
ncbi:PREDICTED: endoribonuclease Dcr-1 [Rhagoletis zephyria]|uniref:endoribonuclease Dcr-1 n=1 Tax=Rhagoletis zephyria TaxID=28612 RepID=UPI000811A76B|nr:PREDICTED: endoribonuclease Dcr-1 [Rhagoletis zephyria]